jgi:copine 1/2/3
MKSVPSFLDYINAGLNMNLTIGVDFTASNGEPTSSGSLHYSNGIQNQYLTAIHEVSKILLNFDSDKEVPLFGFGANLSKFYFGVSHCFALNGNIFRPEVSGIEGIEDTYKKARTRIDFSGPTYFAPLLQRWNEMVKFESEKDQTKYYIYMILTDGAIHDVDETVDFIVESSYLPVSIIIIGIGNANFSAMEFLDADDGPLYSSKYQKFQERDNVQFVEFNSYKSTPHLLARETLCELPTQMLQYFKKRGMTPENLNSDYMNTEARDYFSHKAMVFMENNNQMHFTHDFLPNLIQEGVADDKLIDVNKCIHNYQNIFN